MSKIVSGLTTIAKKVDVSSLVTASKKVDVDSLIKNVEIPTFNTSKIDVGGVDAVKKLDVDALAKSGDGLAGSLKKAETDSFTKKFGDTITNSSFFKKNQKKILALGLTTAGMAAWYGTLLAQGYSPAEAWEKMTDDLESAAGAVAGAAGSAGSAAAEAAIKALWGTFVVFVHNLIGYKIFSEMNHTDMALRVLIALIIFQKVSSLVGFNIFSIIFRRG